MMSDGTNTFCLLCIFGCKNLGFFSKLQNTYYSFLNLYIFHIYQSTPSLEYWGTFPQDYNIFESIENVDSAYQQSSSPWQTLVLRWQMWSYGMGFYRYVNRLCLSIDKQETEPIHTVPRLISIPKFRNFLFAGSFVPRISRLWNLLRVGSFFLST